CMAASAGGRAGLAASGSRLRPVLSTALATFNSFTVAKAGRPAPLTWMLRFKEPDKGGPPRAALRLSLMFTRSIVMPSGVFHVAREAGPPRRAAVWAALTATGIASPAGAFR